MGVEWVAGAGTDPRSVARRIGRAHGVFLAGGVGTPPAGVRSVVGASWRRSSAARVDPDTDPPVLLADDALADYRSGHVLAGVLDVLRELVGGVADDGRHLMAVTDARGRLLWVEGHRDARRRAEAMNFVEGAAWDEPHAGTNAPGTALALDHAVQIFATEHFRHTVQGWSCAAAPIHDPATGQLLGAVDITGGDDIAHPYCLALVRAAARTAEAELRARRPAGVPAVPEGARLAVLGAAEPTLRLGGSTVRLGRRHAEVLFLLATRADGWTGEQLAAALYAQPTSDTAVRVELTRLRQVVGDLVRSRPYRLSRPLALDYLDVTGALRRGEVAAALEAYRGALLPGSEAPAVLEARDWLAAQLRAAVLALAEPGPLHAWAERYGFDDLQVWERLALVASGPVAAIAADRARQLRADYA